MNAEQRPHKTAARRPRTRKARILVALSATFGSLFLLSASAQGAEEETHFFDATLSLTGDGECKTSATIDPVPDPGCPGGIHPPKPFTRHGAVAVDLYGNRYVVSVGAAPDGSEGRIDVFNSSGEFITEVAVEIPNPTVSIAVDSDGYLYVARRVNPIQVEQYKALLRFTPTEYNPAAGEIEYDPVPVAIPNPLLSAGQWGFLVAPLAINPANDHLFMGLEGTVDEFKSAAEGNELVEVVTLDGLNGRAYALALDSVRKRIYVSDWSQPPASGGKPVVKVFNLEAMVNPEEPSEVLPRELLFTINGSTTPTKRFVSETNLLPLAADESTGHLFVGDLDAPTRRVYEYDEAGDLVSTIKPGFDFKTTSTEQLQIAYDDSPTSPTQGYLFVPSHNGPGRSLAFESKPIVEAPIVEALSVSGITTEEAILRGKVNPKGAETAYRFEYTSEAEGFEGATLAGEGTLSPSSEGLAVSAPVSGLSPGTAYRFRLVAENELGEIEEEAAFTTYAPPEVSTGCPNQALRSGPSASLPDCRAYELVTPADTNGHSPFGQQNGTPLFTSRLSSPGGDRVSFQVDGGGLPDFGGTGSFFGDPYLASRGEGGWVTEYTGPDGDFAPAILPGSSAPDQTHSLWRSTGPGPASLEGIETSYLRYPDGHFEPIGSGSLATDPGVSPELVAENAGHVIFSTGSASTSRRLEPDAAPDGTAAIYDRTSDGTLHVVSLLPGDVPLGGGANAIYMGASLDGKGVAFKVGNTLYLRHNNEATYSIGENIEFAGVSEGGGRIFYRQGGDLYRFDAETEATTPFSTSGDVTPVNVSADGSTAYLVSPSVLSAAPNPEGDIALGGAENLYLSRDGQISFVGTVGQRDVEGVKGPLGPRVDGLGLWLEALANPTRGAFATITSRATADGDVLLFESNAALTGYDPEGHTQLYRYDAGENTLRCVSCSPTGAPATGEGALQSIDTAQYLLTYWNPVDNLSSDGKRAFFESTEALVVNDTDGLRDVYEWEEEGVGRCETPGGCVYLITAGQSGRDDYLYAVSNSGNDVFFRSADLLAPAFDPDETPSIYDARVNGGFQPPQGTAGECLGEACQPAAVAPNDPTPASSSFEGAGNVKDESSSARKSCPKGKRAVRRKGKSHCVPRQSKQNSRKQHKRANADRRAHR